MGSRPNQGSRLPRKLIFDIATALDQPYSPYRLSGDATTIFPAMPAHQTRRDCLTGKSVNVLSSLVAKNNSLHPSGKSSLQARAISPERGALAIVTKRAVGCGGRGSAGAQQVFAGRDTP